MRLSIKILYKQAVKARWLAGSEANFLNWVGAAVRATTVSARDPVRLFVSLVKRGQWNFVTQEQEGRARELIRRVRDTSKSAWGAIQNKSLEPELKLSVGEDAQTSFLVRQSRGHLQSSTETLERLQIRKIIEQSFPEIRQRSQL